MLRMHACCVMHVFCVACLDVTDIKKIYICKYRSYPMIPESLINLSVMMVLLKNRLKFH